MNLLNKLEKKFGKYAIRNLMYYIVMLYVLGFAVIAFKPGFYEMYLSLNAKAIMSGEVWRIFTYIIYPPTTSLFMLLIALYFYYSIGSVLERHWGSFRFNLYFFTGVLFNALASILVYLVWGEVWLQGTQFLNLSMFFAFATIFPDMMVLFMWILPIKMKYLAWIEGIYFGVTIVAGFLSNYLPNEMIANLGSVGIVVNKSYAAIAFVSLLNFLIYALSMKSVRRMNPKEVQRRRGYEQSVQRAQAQKNLPRHKCVICGRTEKDSPDLEFRYCSKCEGNYEYCQDHLFTHEHVKKS